MLQKLIQGELKIHELEKYVSAKEARELRLKYIEAITNVDTYNLEPNTLSPEKLINKNIENFIGSVEVPLGTAGPIKLTQSDVSGEYFIPMATTEGALVASISRGCKVLSNSGGVTTFIENKGITRAPVFQTPSLQSSQNLKSLINENSEKLKEIASSTSSHISLIDYKVHILGNNVWLRLNFDTDQAMGMNMATHASKKISDYICNKHPETTLIAVSGNMCVDKKPSQLNTIKGRGISVHAQATIPLQIVEAQLHTTSKAIVATNKIKTWQGSSLSGSIGNNSHIANIIAAIFIATGQDVAHTVDSSIGFFDCQEKDGDLVISLLIPSLLLATVGGGTGLPKQRKCIEIMTQSISNKKKSKPTKQKMAHVIAGATLAGELSVHAALAAGQLTKAHNKLGRSTNE